MGVSNLREITGRFPSVSGQSGASGDPVGLVSFSPLPLSVSSVFLLCLIISPIIGHFGTVTEGEKGERRTEGDNTEGRKAQLNIVLWLCLCVCLCLCPCCFVCLSVRVLIALLVCVG